MHIFPSSHCEKTTWRQRIYNVFLTSTSSSNTVDCVIWLAGWLQCPWFIGQNRWSAAHVSVLISMRCFALTVYGWKRVWRGWDTGLIHLRSFPSWFGITNRKLRTNRRTPGFINLDIFRHTYISLFVRTQTFSVDSTHSFINEAPGLLSIACASAMLMFWLSTSLKIP